MTRGNDSGPDAPYEPPTQSALGQVVDSLLILTLVIASLFAPVYFGLAGDKKLTLTFAGKSWEALGQNAVAQAQWEKLGFTPETAHDMIASRFDYSFSWVWFALTVAVIVTYFVFVIRVSDKEYREVIGERFGSKRSGAPQ
jgi:hypothetical protein